MWRLWRRRKSLTVRMQEMLSDIKKSREEIDSDRREIKETRPFVEEAVRRTNESFLEVERKTRRGEGECSLIRDLTRGWNG